MAPVNWTAVSKLNQFLGVTGTADTGRREENNSKNNKHLKGKNSNQIIVFINGRIFL